MSRRSPFRDRMRAFSAGLPPPPSHPDHELVNIALNRRAEMDVAFRLKVSELKEVVPSFLLTRLRGGSGFTISATLRHYFFEYFDRLNKHGPHSFPSSFNVVESFLSFSDRYLAFDLREEREHVLRLHEYIDWYTAGSFPDKPSILKDILPEGIIYTYNMVSPLEDFSIETADSKLCVLGVGIIRHGGELSAMIVAGEDPPFPTDDEVGKRLAFLIGDSEEGSYQPYPGRRGLKPDPSLGLKDRYIPEAPGRARVVMLARFDLDHSRFDIRYVNLDIGASYLVLTDDRMVFQYEPERERILADSAEKLARYSSLFSALASALYLPAFFIDQSSRTAETKFATSLHAESSRAEVRKAIKAMGADAVPFFRCVRCLVGAPPAAEEAILTIVPPDMEFETSGYWRPLEPGEIGESKDGTPIVGKTWVQRTDSWSAKSLQSFVVSKGHRVMGGKDPGWIYIMRSGSHYDDLYKIGLTRRSSETRAIELSSATGVPTGFEVLAKWEVGDCSRVETEIHERLKAIRVNKRREFFRGNLQLIVRVIDEILRQHNVSV